MLDIKVWLKERALKVKEIRIDKEKCKICGICVIICTKKVLKQTETEEVIVDDLSKCSGCLICEYECPDFAIEIEREEKND